MFISGEKSQEKSIAKMLKGKKAAHVSRPMFDAQEKRLAVWIQKSGINGLSIKHSYPNQGAQSDEKAGFVVSFRGAISL